MKTVPSGSIQMPWGRGEAAGERVVAVGAVGLRAVAD